jgi:hypothetical protein
MAHEVEKAPGGGSYVRNRDGSLKCVQRTEPPVANQEAEPAPAVVDQTEEQNVENT